MQIEHGPCRSGSGWSHDNLPDYPTHYQIYYRAVMPFDWLHQNVSGRRGPIAIIYFYNDQLNAATDVKPLRFFI